jgi:hypothetical protein
MRTAPEELTASVKRIIAQYHKEFLLDVINFRLFKFGNSIEERSMPLGYLHCCTVCEPAQLQLNTGQHK